ncbi:MAG: hypothetical protein AAFZ11_03615 [Pseudomonadota bacterium]
MQSNQIDNSNAVVTISGRKLIPVKADFLGKTVSHFIDAEEISQAQRRVRDLVVKENGSAKRARANAQRLSNYSLAAKTVLGGTGLTIGATIAFSVAAISLISVSFIMLCASFLYCYYLDNHAIMHEEEAANWQNVLEEIS